MALFVAALLVWFAAGAGEPPARRSAPPPLPVAFVCITYADCRDGAGECRARHGGRLFRSRERPCEGNAGAPLRAPLRRRAAVHLRQEAPLLGAALAALATGAEDDQGLSLPIGQSLGAFSLTAPPAGAPFNPDYTFLARLAGDGEHLRLDVRVRPLDPAGPEHRFEGILRNRGAAGRVDVNGPDGQRATLRWHDGDRRTAALRDLLRVGS